MKDSLRCNMKQNNISKVRVGMKKEKDRSVFVQLKAHSHYYYFLILKSNKNTITTLSF